MSECVREHIHIQIYIGCIYNIYNIHTPRLPHGRGTNARRRSLTVCGALLLQLQKTPLHWAAQNGHGSVVDQLLQGRADVNLKDQVRAGSRVFVFVRGDVGLFSCGGDSVYVCACVYTYMYTYIYILYDIIRYHIIYA